MDDLCFDYLEEEVWIDSTPPGGEMISLEEAFKKVYQETYTELGLKELLLETIEKINSGQPIPLTEEMIRYIKVDQELKFLETKKENLRREIIKQAELLPYEFEGIKINKVKSRPINNEKYYEWVSSIVPAGVLEEITTKQIDYTKFSKLYLKGKIEYDPESIPDDLLDERESYRITIQRSKK